MEKVKTMKDTNSGSNLVFFLLGAAVGATVALLYAPNEGEETRRQLGEKAHEVKDRATEVSGKVKERATEVSGNVANTARETWDKTSSNVSSTAKNLSAKANDLLHRSRVVGTEIASDVVAEAEELVAAASNGTN